MKASSLRCPLHPLQQQRPPEEPTIPVLHPGCDTGDAPNDRQGCLHPCGPMVAERERFDGDGQTTGKAGWMLDSRDVDGSASE
jgi:hypothetical protein